MSSMAVSSPDHDFGNALLDFLPCKDAQSNSSPLRFHDHKMRSKSVSNVEGSRNTVIDCDQRMSCSRWSDYKVGDSDQRPGARPERSRSQLGSRQRHQAKIAQEERQELLNGWYDCEVVQRGKTHAWVKPLNESDMPEDVRLKLQEMNYEFRRRHEAHGKRFCGGILENVIYVCSLDLSSLKGVALIVGMKVRLKLYTDNKGVGGYDVIPSKEHIEKIRDAIQKNFETQRGLEKTMHLTSILRGKDGNLKNVLFVGECTHAFSVAAGRLCDVVDHEGDAAHGSSLDENATWCSTELIWPKGRERSDLERLLVRNLRLLHSSGIWCADEIDAHDLKNTLEARSSPCLSFDTIFWMMPYVSENKTRPHRLSGMMQDYILSFVRSATEVVSDEGSIAVVVTSTQCVSWRLCQRVLTDSGKVFVPEVWWFDVSKVEQYGYQSRFGDGRDGYVDCPGFHMLIDLVIVCWRERTAIDGDSGCDPRDGCVSVDDIMERKRMLEHVGHESMERGSELQDPHMPNCNGKDIPVTTSEVCEGIRKCAALRCDDVPDVGDLVLVLAAQKDPPPGFQLANFLLPLAAGDTVKILQKEQEANTVWLWAQKENCESRKGWVLLEWLQKRNERSNLHEDGGCAPSDGCVSGGDHTQRARMLEGRGHEAIGYGLECEDRHTRDSGKGTSVPTTEMCEGICKREALRCDDVPDIGDLVQVLVPRQDPPPGFQLANFLLPLTFGDTVQILHKEQEFNTVWLWAHKDKCEGSKGWILLEWLQKRHERSNLHEYGGGAPGDGCVSGDDNVECNRMLHETIGSAIEFEAQHAPDCQVGASALNNEVCEVSPDNAAPQIDVPHVGDLALVLAAQKDPPPGFQLANFLLPLEAGDAVKILQKEQEANTVWLWAHKANCESSKGWILLEWLQKTKR